MKAVCESFHLAKDAGFKVVAHMMPDLPNMGLERDIDQFVVSMIQTSTETPLWPLVLSAGVMRQSDLSLEKKLSSELRGRCKKAVNDSAASL